MDTTISEIKKLQRIRLILNCLQFLPPCRFFRDLVGDKKQMLADSLLDEVAKESGLYDKFRDMDLSSLKPIGNRVWMFWYTGLESAPPIGRKGVSIVSKLPDVDLVVIDKTNLEEYFIFEGNIKQYFENGNISIQTFSDILRCQLLSRWGGFWFDATLFVTRQDFILTHKNLTFFTIHHLTNDSLLKKKWNEYFTEGRWSGYGCGGGKNNPIFSFIYEMFLKYYDQYEVIFDYFQIDYIWLYAYTHFEWAKMMIDSVAPSVSCSYFLGQNMLKPFDPEKWNQIIAENEFQKLRWKIEGKASNRKTYYDHFIGL